MLCDLYAFACCFNVSVLAHDFMFLVRVLHMVEYDVTISGIFGKHGWVGEGKTMFMTRLAMIQHEKDNNLLIYSNYKMPFTKPIDHINKLAELENCYVFYDDITSSLDSRQSMINVQETWILTTIRKKKIDLCFTAQFEELVEFRLRKLCHFIFEVEKTEFPVFHIEVFTPVGLDVKRIDEYDFIAGQDIIDMYNTCEVVSKKISMVELISLAEENKKTSFQTISRIQFGFNNKLALAVWDLIQTEKYKLLERLLEGNGYKLIKKIVEKTEVAKA